MNEYETPIDQIRPISASDKKIDMNSIMKYESEIQQPSQQQFQLQQLQQQQQQQLPQQLPMNTIYEHQQFPMKPKEKENTNKEIDLNEILSKDNVYLVLAISIIFSEGLQKHISKVLPNLYIGDKISFIGIILHAIIVVIGLFLIKKVNIKIGS